MDIRRIDSYDDMRFSKEVLEQHGGFIIDGRYPCSFKIIGENAAQIDYSRANLGSNSDIVTVIEYFRFFAEHINRFYDKDGNHIISYEPVQIKTLFLDEIQPSQFYADEDKIKAISSFIKSGDDIVIPVNLDLRTNRYISLDGHTRMYYAYLNGFKTVRAFETEHNDCVAAFADEAARRGVRSVSDIVLLSHDEYEIKWNRFCDEFLKDNND